MRGGGGVRQRQQQPDTRVGVAGLTCLMPSWNTSSSDQSDDHTNGRWLPSRM